jgi:YVTN family beta-propeller protein
MLPQVRPPLGAEGEVLLYAQPFPQEADRLRFRIEAISARRDDGMEFPVALKLPEIKGREMTRQRFLGDAVLPPGAYLGLTMKVRDAFLRTEEGEAALLTAEAPVRIDFPFRVAEKRASLLWLTFQWAEGVKSGFSFSPAFRISVPPRPVSGLTGYVTSGGSNNVLIFDKGTGQVAGVIATEGGPAGMALDQKGFKAYVALPSADVIEVIDVIAGEITDTITLTMGDRPKELGLTPDGKTLLSLNAGSNTVSFIDVASHIQQARVFVGMGPASILIDPNGRRAYVFNNLSSTISVLDVANKALVTTIGTDPGPIRGQFNSQGDTFYVISQFSPYMSVITAATLSTKRMYVAMGLNSIKIDTSTGFLYMGRVRDPQVGIYDPNALVPMDYLNAGGAVTYMTIDGEMNNLLMVGPEVERVVAANLISRRVLWAIDVGEAPYWVTLMGER